MTARRLLVLAIAYLLVVLVLLLGGTSQAAPVQPQDARATWVGPRTLTLSWVQQSDANKVTITRCRIGESCYLVAAYDSRPGAHQITDIYAFGGDSYWIGEFRDTPDGALAIYGWSGPYRAPYRYTLLPLVSAHPAR